MITGKIKWMLLILNLVVAAGIGFVAIRTFTNTSSSNWTGFIWAIYCEFQVSLKDMLIH